jgi:hypothetical protein
MSITPAHPEVAQRDGGGMTGFLAAWAADADGEDALRRDQQATATAMIARRAFQEAQRHPSKSIGRLAAAEVCAMATHELTVAGTRERLLRKVSDPVILDVALTLLGELAALADAAAAETASAMPTPTRKEDAPA